ncbi:MAG: glycosyltransferase [Cyclobacteriaceae bacterium]
MDEPRMFERMGQSLASRGFDVYLIGTPSSSDQSFDGIKFIPHPKPERLSAKRVLVRFRILKEIFSLRPDILIISTHELLGVAILYKVLTGQKIIYDIQENYFKNIVHTNAFPKAVRLIVASLVRLKETVASVFVSKFILAEQCYADEIKFIGKKYSVIENKCKVPDHFQRLPESGSIRLLFTGTLAESTGVFQAIDFAKHLNKIDSRITLTIVGYCALPNTLERIRSEITDSPFIQLIGGENFVSHAHIMKSISVAHFGLICYPPSPHIQNKIPTKLYEYLACQLPIIIQKHEHWEEMCSPYDAAISIDFNQFDTNGVMKEMNEKKFYSSTPSGVTWQSEEDKFIKVIESVIE